jgi:hypothetical protein
MRVTATIALLVLAGTAGCESRDEARRKQVANNMKQLSLALEAYHGKYAKAEDISAEGTSGQVATTDASNADGADRRAGKSTTVRGEVAEFRRSPDGEIDGIELKDGTEVRFPPNSGESVAAFVSIGNNVEITGWTHAEELVFHAATVTNLETGQSAEVDEPPPGTTE